MQQIGQDYIPLIVFSLMLIGISALIAAKVPTRRLWLAALLWLFAPAILMAIVLGLGNLMSPAQGSGASNLVFGIMLIGMFVVVPWLVVCAIGFAIGFAVRRKSPPVQTIDAPPIVPESRQAPAMAQPAAPASPQHFFPSTEPNPHFSHASPDGSLRIDIEPVEWANSQWVHTPRVVEAASGRILCDLLGSDWEGQTAFPRAHYVWLGLRRYRTPGHLFADFDLEADRYRIALHSLESPDEEGPLGDISDRLEYWWPQATALAMAGAPVPHPAPQPHPFAAWRTALVILVGAIAAIAGLTYFSMETGIEPPHVPILHPGFGVPR